MQKYMNLAWRIANMNRMHLKLEQVKLAGKVITTDSFEEISLIGGCDQAYTNDGKIVSTIVVLDKNLKVVDSANAVAECRMPYIPGYLFYREAHVIIEAFNKLKQRPEILVVDGNGILHPRRIGMASQLGIVLDIPTIGVAKTLMMGQSMDGRIEVDKEIRAIEVRTREFAKPLYVSPGHRISLKTAVEMIQKMIVQPHKLPEPLHLAHRFADKKRDRLANGPKFGQEPLKTAQEIDV